MNALLVQAVAALNAGDCPQAFRLLTTLLLADPGNAAGWYNLGSLHERLGQWWSSVAAFRRSDELVPNVPGTLMALGWHLHLAGRTAEAEPILRRVLELDPGLAMARTNLSHVLATLGRDAEGLRYAMQASDLDPNAPLVRLGLAFGLFFAGRWEDGWREFEARLPLKMADWLQYPVPRWDGGKVGTLFLRGEQGVGDSLMMARYFDAVAQLADRVILHVQTPLVGLCRERWPSFEVFGMPSMLPEGGGAWCPLMSLPRYVAAAKTPYLPAGKGQWPPRRVGLAWAGDPAHANDGHRSMLLRDMLRVTEVSGVEFVSLQVGPRGTPDLNETGAHALVRDMAPEISDMRDTARLVSGLDLVICVDTAVSHLAGAMGVPCWVLVNQRGLDWRHGRAGEKSRWYYSHRIFRRGLDEQWSDVMGRVTGELRACAGDTDSALAA